MTSEIINMLKGSNLVKKAIDIFVKMINGDEYLYNEAWRVITTEETIDHIPQSFYDKDIEVNNQEKEIRRLLFEHLSIRPGHDTSGCLALMSLIKDAERIGDYSKNIFEAGILHGGNIRDIKFYKRMIPTQNKIAESFPVLAKAFKKSDTQLAQEILRNYTPIKRDCDKILNELFEQEVSPNEAVVTAMLSRYFKRINSHVSNIASGIVYPLNEIDFVSGDILE
ncbi:MAG: phosphate uptake regulator PhoU [Dehalococcoidales bacterium]|nr:MAG: phosphate uptake regulator PhoU [Dehalococcoidales bacterium]